MSISTLPGAVVDAERKTLLHFGSLASEQKSLETGALVWRPDRRVFQLSGSERLTWLDSLTSQSVRNLQDGQSAETLILDPHGHVEFVLHLVETGEVTWLILAEFQADAASEWLSKMRFRSDVELRDLSGDYEILASLTAEPPAVLTPEAVWQDPWPGVVAGGFAYSAEPYSWTYSEWIVASAEVERVESMVRAHELTLVGSLALTAAEIAAGRPDASDLDEKSLPHEFDWLRTAVHLNKGCYRGQETVAKVHNLGRPPRRLVQLHLDGSLNVLPVSGDEIWGLKVSADGTSQERLVGHVTRAAQHYEWGPIALALVARAVPADLVLSVRHVDPEGQLHTVSASQNELVPHNAGANVEIPRFPRMGVRP